MLNYLICEPLRLSGLQVFPHESPCSIEIMAGRKHWLKWLFNNVAPTSWFYDSDGFQRIAWTARSRDCKEHQDP